MRLIHPSIEKHIHQFIAGEFRGLGCQARIINGTPDHIHCLFLLNPQKTISDVVKQIKGSSSHYVNRNNLISDKFAWQKGYAAFSVSESGVEKVVDYLRKQKIHHQEKTFQQEYEEFINLYKVEL